MSAPRFYVAPHEATLASGVELALPAGVARHALQVLRLRAGDAMVLFDGRGGEYPATLLASGKEARASVGTHADVERETPHATTLVQGVVAADVMDWIVRKAVELGARAIQPVVAARSPRADTKTATYPGRRTSPMRLGAGATRKRPRVPVLGGPIGVATTPLRRVARRSAAASPDAPLRSIPGTAIGGKPVTSVAGR